MNKLEITVKYTNEKGEVITEAMSEKEVPFLREFEKEGFTVAFDKLETAVLEARKEAGDDATEKYLEKLSQKKTKK